MSLNDTLEEEFSGAERLYFNDDELDLDLTKTEEQLNLNENYAPNVLDYNQFDVSIQDEQENEVISKFFDEPCCSKKCNFEIPRNLIEESRMNFLDLDKEQQDLVILSQIQSGKKSKDLTSVYDKNSNRKKYGVRNTSDNDSEKEIHENVDYRFLKISTCQNFFLFIHSCGIKRFKSLLSHYSMHGIAVRQHGNSFKPSTNKTAISKKEIDQVVQFIKAVADRIALPLPGRMPKFKDYSVMKLPSSESMTSIHRMFISSLSPGDKVIKNRSFRNIWRTYVPYITVMKPADDLCDKCRGNTLVISQLKNCPDKIRQKKIDDFNDHLQKAKDQRTFYQTLCQDENSNIKVVSFDFAQTVHYPVSPQQPGSAYFKSLRKCAVFGITNEKEKVQTNFLIDEKDEIGKGPNCVISLLHHYLNNSSDRKTTQLNLFSDNCVGQNKNNAVLHYLMWRVAKGLQKKISFNFLLTGHTKFSPDRFFGLFKSKYAVSNIDTHKDLMKCVTDSSPSGHNKAVSGENVTWYDWVNHLKQFYKPLVGITSFHHFEITADTVIAKTYANETETKEFKLLLLPIDKKTMPEIIPLPGLPLERQWYLYNNIRELVFNKEKEDDVAPLPKEELVKPNKTSTPLKSKKDEKRTTKKVKKTKETETKVPKGRKNVKKSEKTEEEEEIETKKRKKKSDSSSPKKKRKT